ncbi:MAG: ATP-dependent Clp protease adaptor ClpS [Actinomycetaceae bacterium]|nr:ATP-dependent Clp protease adaptor ClpS [Actinomycetaceae bacterium]
MTTATSLTHSPRSTAETAPPWRAVIWHDPIVLMAYVARVLRNHFGLSASAANDVLHEISEKGQATVASGTREHMEADVAAMHAYGLRATLETGTE